MVVTDRQYTPGCTAEARFEANSVSESRGIANGKRSGS